MARVMNALTVDVEDYFQVSAFDALVRREDWPRLESRVARNTERLLTLFERAGARATFFVLGWVAERCPQLIRRIHASGHELASHSYAHRLVYDTTPDEFRADLRRAQAAIGDAAGVTVRGYRAPSYSIVERSLWALDVLVEEGYAYDSSIYPIRHDRYGIPKWDRYIHRVQRSAGQLWELPGSTIQRLTANLPIGGGGYFRLLPYGWTRYGIRELNEKEGQPAIFYIHPWEIDPDQPRLNAGVLTRFRHYRNLDRTETRLTQLLADFSFGAISDVLRLRQASAGAAPSLVS
jgi:polysaccharide deacetylase family protein (PEP-CTERM system associated)